MRKIVDKVIHHLKKWPTDNYNYWNTMVGQLTPDEKDYVLSLFQFKFNVLNASWRHGQKLHKRI